jgi:hypothetical protein
LRGDCGRGNLLRTMEASNKPERPDGTRWVAAAGRHAGLVRELWAGAVGRTVRCVPTRRTVIAPSGDGSVVFGKWRRGERRSGAAEWRWLHLLPLVGLRTAAPVAWIGERGRSLLVTAGVPGRSLDAWAAEAAASGWLPELVRYATQHVAPVIRRLHGSGLVYRDLYWNHLFTDDPRGGSAPTFIDVERVFQPRWRRQRWIVKDLAGLLASAPAKVGARAALRFLRAYLGEPLERRRRLIRAVAAKAARIRRHQPRYG